MDPKTETLEPTATDETTETAEETMPDGLTDGGKAALKAERDARKQAAKEAREAKAELERLRAEKAEADRIKAEQDEAEAVKRGEFEKLATERAETIKVVTGERDSLKATLDSLITAIKPEIEAAWNDVPEEIRAFYDGGDDDVLAKRAFLAKSKPAIDRLNAEQEKKNAALKGFPKTPQPDHRDMKPADDEAARKRQARTVSTI